LLAIARSREEAERKARAAASRVEEDFDAQRDRWLLGTPEDIRGQLQAFIDVGVTYWVIGMGAPFDLQGLELFANEVIPAFR
jgi:alkanesulfonate monooxygenase SsuD/methylene tetrahydromethanopterin reductase-like flavin-dependent oxidoreductase (luciferase family)